MFIAAWNGGIIIPPCTIYEKNINVAGTTNNLYKKICYYSFIVSIRSREQNLISHQKGRCTKIAAFGINYMRSYQNKHGAQK